LKFVVVKSQQIHFQKFDTHTPENHDLWCD